MHSSLAITSRGVPLGLSAIKFWTRRKFKGTNALKRKINPTRVPIEEKESIRWLDSLHQSMTLLQCPERCVHVGDRESDIYELFCLSRELDSSFLVRTCVDRLAGDGKHTISDEMQNESIKYMHNVVLWNENEIRHEVMLSVRWKKILVRPPIGESKQYPDITYLPFMPGKKMIHQDGNPSNENYLPTFRSSVMTMLSKNLNGMHIVGKSRLFIRFWNQAVKLKILNSEQQKG